MSQYKSVLLDLVGNGDLAKSFKEQSYIFRVGFWNYEFGK